MPGANYTRNLSFYLKPLIEMKPSVINVQEKFSHFQEQWSPKIVGALNGQFVKIAKVEGDFVWHQHENEDELFWVVKGELTIELRDQTLVLREGEMTIIPRGVEHKPTAEKECWIMMFEPQSTLNTGGEVNDRTVQNLPWV